MNAPAEYPAKDDDHSRDERKFGRPQESADQPDQPELPFDEEDEGSRAAEEQRLRREREDDDE